MARYRKLDLRTWNDKKFGELSPIQPSGQSLWLILILGPQTTNIPGLFEASEVAMADRLGWSLEAFREAFREVSSKGMAKADWRARLVWLPRATEYNNPESPNVVKSWATTFDELPECDLKWEAYQSLKAFTKGMKKAFHDAFLEAFPKPSPKTIPYQEQEQEQEQEQDLTEGGMARSENPRDESGERPKPAEPFALNGSHPPASKPGKSGPKPLTVEDLHASLPRETWTEWLDHRRRKKWPVDGTTLRKQLEILAPFDTATQRKMINDSIQAGWQGIFEPKGANKPQQQSERKLTRFERDRQLLDNLPGDQE